MSEVLQLRTKVQLPPGQPGAFDHGAVDTVTGRMFIAHTAFDTVEVVAGESLKPVGQIRGCAGGSGVVCAARERLVFAAARGSGEVLVIDADGLTVQRRVEVGPRPNGLAWDGRRRQLLVADVDSSGQSARLLEPESGAVVAEIPLPGRPRWCVFDERADRFLVNIREPASLLSLAAGSGQLSASWPIPSAGPHGLDIDAGGGRAFVACDGGRAVAVALEDGRVLGESPISGVPDAIWFNSKKERLYVAVAHPGLIDVVDTRAMELVESIPTEAGAQTTAFDESRQRLYVFLPDSCAVAVLDDV